MNFDKTLSKTLHDLQDFQRWATPPMEEGIDTLHQRVQKYPPPKPTYIRTHTLQRSIARMVERSQSGIIGRVYSTGANQGRGFYEHFVKVRETQAYMHVGWWPTTEDDLNAEKANLERLFKEAVPIK